MSLHPGFFLMPLTKQRVRGVGWGFGGGGDVTDQSSWPSPITRNWLEAREEIQAKFYWGPCCWSREREQTAGSLAHSMGEGSWFLTCGVRVQGMGVSRVWAGGVACPSLRWWCVQGTCSVPCFCFWPPVLAPGSSVDLLVSLYLLGPEFAPNFTYTWLFFIPYSFFLFCCWRKGVSMCKHCS